MNASGEKLKEFFKKNAGYVAVAIISLIYIATSIVTLGRTGKTIADILADSTIVMLLGFSINRIFDLQGLMMGDRDERVKAILKKHDEALNSVARYMDKLDLWCEMKNAEALRVQRTKILAGAGLKYENCFDENGEALPYEINKEKLKDKYFRGLELRKFACYKKAVKLKLTPLTAGDLSSEGGKKQDPFFLGRTKKQYEKGATISDIISKLIIAAVFGYYGAQLIQDFSWADLIWKLLQIGVFLIAGVIKMYKSYMFIVDEYRGRVIKKIDNLLKFKNYVDEEKIKESINGNEEEKN